MNALITRKTQPHAKVKHHIVFPSSEIEKTVHHGAKSGLGWIRLGMDIPRWGEVSVFIVLCFVSFNHFSIFCPALSLTGVICEGGLIRFKVKGLK